MENNAINQANLNGLNENEQNYADVNNEPKNHKFTNVDFLSKDTNLNIKIIGVGGAGCNIINHLNAKINEINSFATLYAFNTDAWSLKRLNGIDNLYIIDKTNLKGYGSCGNPYNAQQGIIHDSEEIKNELKETDVLFLVTGFGKGTGSGATPEIAKIATELGILTIAIVGMPSITCEGKETYDNAFASFKELKKYASSITTICNERIVTNNPGINFFDLYNKANDEFAIIVNHIINMVMKPSQINIDFSDIRDFFINNKFFMLNHLILDDGKIEQSKFNQIIANQINTNISDVNVWKSKSIISKLILSQTTSNDFLLSFKKACMNAINNENVKVVSGVDYSSSQQIELTYVIAATDELTNLEEKVFETKPKETDNQTTISKEEKVDEFTNLIEEINSVLEPTKELKSKVEEETSKEDTKPEINSNENDIG